MQRSLDAAGPSSGASTAWEARRRRVATLWQPRDFLGQYGEVTRTRTRSGYNPMLEDYTNTRVLTT